MADLDLCLRLSRAGSYSVFTPYAELKPRTFFISRQLIGTWRCFLSVP